MALTATNWMGSLAQAQCIVLAGSVAGVLLYVLERGDKAGFAKWLTWLENNRPCLAELRDTCLKYGWLRFCRDDPDKRCTLRPADCVRIESVAQKLGVDGSLCRRVMQELGLPEDVLLPLGNWLVSSAAVNKPGFPQHLVGVGVLLARKLQVDVAKGNFTAAVLATRTADNPFFRYLSDGATPTVTTAILATCPHRTGHRQTASNGHGSVSLRQFLDGEHVLGMHFSREPATRC